MSMRERSPRFTAAANRYVLLLTHGQKCHRIVFSRAAIWGGGAMLCLAGAALIGAAAYLLFRDDMLAALLDRQTQMQYAYEDRVAALRLRLDQAVSRQFIDQDGVEGKVQSLVMRQAQLETRAAVVAQLVEKTIAHEDATTVSRGLEARQASGAPSIDGVLAINRALPPSQAKAASQAEEEGALSYAPKPQPEVMDLRLGKDADGPPTTLLRKNSDDTAMGSPPESGRLSSASSLTQAADPDLPMPARLERLTLSLDHIEREQTSRLSSIAKPALAAANRLRHAFDVAGLQVERYLANKGRPAGSAVGGPFVAADPKTSLFERELATARNAVTALDGLRRALPTVPLRKPFWGELQLTSTFGYRTDPFLGRPALHSGVDLREEYGAPARATAGGTVTAAGPNGGYGNMVEVDHGGGLSTRYAHLSSISVSPGQQIVPGAVVGRVGSTGRSTGPHLHYEVRVGGEPVDPQRFLKAATALDGPTH
jgi:murein DD-endopeptidase MepM/ murein hydrolase activator NlpD